MRDDTFLSINHAPGIATHYNRVIVIINPTETECMTSIFSTSKM
jgi:pterin-4a-carbinolamine dehydratase